MGGVRKIPAIAKNQVGAVRESPLLNMDFALTAILGVVIINFCVVWYIDKI